MKIMNKILLATFLTIFIISTNRCEADLVFWSSNWDSATDSGTYFVNGVTVGLSVSGANTLEQAGDYLRLQKTSSASQEYLITFSSPVTFSLPIGHLNSNSESVQFSLAPTSSMIDDEHVLAGNTLQANSSEINDVSTLTWTYITSLTFDHVFTPSQAALDTYNATIVTVPEPGGLSLMTLALAVSSAVGIRRKRRINPTIRQDQSTSLQ